MAVSDAGKAGAVVFVGTVQFIIGMVLAEVYYPGYSVSTNSISDLGANSYPPSATIFNTSIIILGILVLVGSYFLYKSFRWRPLTWMVALAGIGAVGVGVFPETTGNYHDVSELLAFLFGGLSAIIAFRFQKPPMSYFSVVLGATTLVALILFVGSTYLGLGHGGMERLIVYPELLWGVGFSAHLMSM